MVPHKRRLLVEGTAVVAVAPLAGLQVYTAGDGPGPARTPGHSEEDSMGSQQMSLQQGGALSRVKADCLSGPG